MPINYTQYEQLMKPLHPSRVAKRTQAGRELSYLEAYDVRAHLIRVFGFGNFDVDLLKAEIVSTEKGQDGKWEISVMAQVRLSIRVDGSYVCEYSDLAVGTSKQPSKGEAYDMAAKTATSDALKRCAINLGTQFGLSLYQDGTLKDIVKGTLVHPEAPPQETDELEEAVKEVTETLGGMVVAN